MVLKRSTKLGYKCRHCGLKHDSAYMADICFMLDMKLLEHKKPPKNKKDVTINNKSANGRKNQR
jgi:hypothetical protein